MIVGVRHETRPLYACLYMLKFVFFLAEKQKVKIPEL